MKEHAQSSNLSNKKPRMKTTAATTHRFVVSAIFIGLAFISLRAPTADPQSTGQPPVGIYMTDKDDAGGPQTYLSIWEKDKKLTIGLTCEHSCIPGKGEAEDAPVESYIGQKIQEVSAGVWDVSMKFEASEKKKPKVPAEFKLRLHFAGDKTAIEIAGTRKPIHSTTFQESVYHSMGDYGTNLEMVFTADKGNHLLWKFSPKDGRDTGWLYLSDGRSQAASVKNWHYVLAKSDHQMGSFVQIAGEMTIGAEHAEIRVDVMRSPVSDVSFKLIRKGRAERFTQANDSNVHLYESCSASEGKNKCRRLYSLIPDRPTRCPHVEPSAFLYLIWDESGTTYELVSADEKKKQLLDAKCKPAYTFAAAEDFTKLVLKNPAGKETIFVKKGE